MKPVSFYHIWVGDARHGSAWKLPAEEHFAALHAAEFNGDVAVGLVGGDAERNEACDWLFDRWPDWRLATAAEEGYEQVTIEALHTWCKTADPATPVFYAHTKGAFQACEMNHRWRRAMTEMLVGGWRDRVADLETYDVSAMHWLTHEQYPDWIHPLKPMAGGNFWWARAGYVVTLDRVTGTPEFPPVNRWAAEGWLGQKFPKVRDLCPGWPLYT